MAKISKLRLALPDDPMFKEGPTISNVSWKKSSAIHLEIAPSATGIPIPPETLEILSKMLDGYGDAMTSLSGTDGVQQPDPMLSAQNGMEVWLQAEAKKYGAPQQESTEQPPKGQKTRGKKTKGK